MTHWQQAVDTLAAWALTHWKAQGMTLERARIHLSERTAGVPEIGRLSKVTKQLSVSVEASINSSLRSMRQKLGVSRRGEPRADDSHKTEDQGNGTEKHDAYILAM